MRGNRGLIGTKSDVTTTDATGIFNTFDVYNARRNDLWPSVALSHVTDSLYSYLDSSDSNSYSGINGVLYDLSGNSRNGTLTNGPFHSQGPFVGAGSVFFDGQGTHSQLDVIYTSALSGNFDLSGSIDSTVELWVYLNSYPLTTEGGNTPHWSAANMFSIKNSTSIARYYHFTINTSGKLRMSADYATGSFPNTGDSTSTISLNTWYHIAWVRDGGSNRYFLNGTEITSQFSTPNASGMIGSGNSKISIGADFYAASTLNWLRPITGYISNFRVVKGSALYTSNFTPSNTSLTSITNTKLLTCQGSSITDASSINNTLSTNGGPTSTYSTIPYLEFDGTDDYIDVSSSLPDSFWQGNWTASFWVYLDYLNTSGGSSQGHVFIHHGTQSTYKGLHVIQRESKYLLALYFTVLKSSSNATINSWTNVVFTLNNTTKLAQIYIDGSLDNSGTLASAYTGTGSNARLGGKTWGTHSDGYLNGRMGSAMFYNKVLSSTEISQNYNAQKATYGL